jgi:hypothetical protein
MRKYFIAAAVALSVFAMSAFAASLTVNAGILQAGDGLIGECLEYPDEVVAVSYGSGDWEDGGSFMVDTLIVDDSDECTGGEFQIVVADGEHEKLALGSGVFEAGQQTITVSPKFDATDAVNVHVMIRNADTN